MDDKDMASYPGLKQRDGKWYIRVVIPKRLAALDPRGSIRKSLDTANRAIALERYRVKLGEIQAYLNDLDRRFSLLTRTDAAAASGKLEDLSHVEIEAMVQEWWEKRTEHRERDAEEPPATLEEIADLRELERYPLSIDAHGNDPLNGLVDQLLVDAGFQNKPLRIGKIKSVSARTEVKRTTSAYKYLRSLVERALRIEEAMIVDRATGASEAPLDTLFNPNGTTSGIASAERPRTVEDLIQAYGAEREAEYGKESTVRKYTLLFRAMREHWGPDLPVRQITRQRVTEMIGFIKTIPPNATKRFRDLSLAQASAATLAAGMKPITPGTANGYVQNLFAVLRWAEDQEWIAKAPIRGLSISRQRSVKRRGFTPTELEVLFTALAPFRETEPSKFWVPALALYSGARAGELCQLRRSDVRRDDDQAFLDFSVFDADTGERLDDKRLKTEASERIVPIHADLVAAGFLDYVNSRDTERLFPELVRGTKDNYSHNLSKWFGRFKKTVGFDQRSLVLHSFRHGFRDACRTAMIPEETALALGGWATGKQASGYGDRAARVLLAKAMEQIRFGDFSLPSVIAKVQNSNN